MTPRSRSGLEALCRKVACAAGAARLSTLNLGLLHVERGRTERALPLAREAAHRFAEIGHAA